LELVVHQHVMIILSMSVLPVALEEENVFVNSFVVADPLLFHLETNTFLEMDKEI
jgi:hypothetical protein